jgi:hypothetical protein
LLTSESSKLDGPTNLNISKSSRIATLANFSREGIASLAQFLMVPLFLASLGQSGYATWLTINSYTAFILMSDFGLLVVVTVYLTNSVTSRNVFVSDIWSRCRLLTLRLSVIIATLVFAIYWGIGYFLKGNVSGRKTEIIVFIFLAILAIFSIWQHILLSNFQIHDKYGQAMSYLAIIRLVEVSVICILLTLKIQILELSFAYLVVRGMLTLILWQKLRLVQAHPLHVLENAPAGTFRGLINPSIGIAALNFASMLGIHGSFLVSTLWLNPRDLITLAIARMIASPIRMLSSALLIGTFPDFIKRDMAPDRDLHLTPLNKARSHFYLVFIAIVLSTSVIIIFLSPLLWSFLSAGSLDYVISLILLFTVATILDAMIGLLAQAYVSRNQAHKIGYLYLTVTLSLLALQQTLGLAFHLQAVPITIILTDLITITLFVILKLTRKA